MVWIFDSTVDQGGALVPHSAVSMSPLSWRTVFLRHADETPQETPQEVKAEIARPDGVIAALGSQL
jgi:hypothetical protein